ncbi:MAG: hypothetical protein DI535_11920 [Citrobacter freundii]|nr:MAG: hypothetical protein DI535_11920 [Citrobacter freundii]
MKALILFVNLALAGLIFSGCSKRTDCGCVPPPTSEANWKIVSRNGGTGGGSIPLTTIQQNSVLTLKNDGKYACTNKQTGEAVGGTYTIISNFASIYGEKVRFVFTPKLPILETDMYVLLENPNGKLVFGDNAADGYSTTFSATQP